MTNKPIEALRAALRAALMAGEDTATIRNEIEADERAQRAEAEVREHAEAEAKAVDDAAIEREARIRTQASVCRLQTLIQPLEV